MRVRMPTGQNPLRAFSLWDVLLVLDGPLVPTSVVPSECFRYELLKTDSVLNYRSFGSCAKGVAIQSKVRVGRCGVRKISKNVTQQLVKTFRGEARTECQEDEISSLMQVLSLNVPSAHRLTPICAKPYQAKRDQIK